jgi:hypothetical protein
MSDRILWNSRDGNDIDEIVIHDCTVHVEQQDDRCWWIGIWRPDGTEWSGNFAANSRGQMRFMEQENDGIVWVEDDEHKETTDE